MFFHDKRLQYNAQPERPDPVFARKLQEVLGGQFGEMSVMMQYLFQGWNFRGPAKYRDMLLDIGTEEIAHVEMLANCISRLLDHAPVEAQEHAAQNPILNTVMGGGRVNTPELMAAAMDPQHAIVTGQGSSPNDSNGFPWTARYIVASGNLLADARANLNAESQGRLQVCRLYNMTDDPGVRDMMSFMIARDTMHQNQWAAVIADLEAAGLEGPVVPGKFPKDQEYTQYSYQFWNLSAGQESAAGLWAQGESPDGQGKFEYVADPQPLGPEPVSVPGDPRLFGTDGLPDPQAPTAPQAPTMIGA